MVVVSISRIVPAIRPGALFVVALLAVLVVVRPSMAAESIRSFVASYEVRPDGTVAVEEEITWDFGNATDRHGIFRDLLLTAKCGPPRQDAEQPLVPCEEGKRRRWQYSAFDVKAAPLGQTPGFVEWTSSRVDDALRLKIGDADVTVSGVWVYRVSYTIEGALDAFASHDELNWNALGLWPQTVESVRIDVRLPAGAEVRATCFEGPTGSRDVCPFEANANRAHYESSGPIASAEQLTIVAGWQKGIVDVPPPTLEDIKGIEDFFTGDALEFGGAVGAGALGFASVAMLWWRHGRDRRYRTIYYLNEDAEEHTKPLFGHDDIVVEYLPPSDLKPAQMGVILDERADPLDITATIIDLAVRGYLHITEIEKGKGLTGIFSKEDWKLTKLKEAGNELAPFEREVMSGLFSSGDEVELSDLKNKFYKTLAKAQDDLYEDALARRWFPRRPGTTKGIWVAIGIGAALLGAGFAFVMGSVFARAAIGIPLIVAGMVLAGLAPSMPRRTANGSEALRRVLGFRLYVSTAETHRQEFNEQQNIFARYLPYAIVFGCVEKWAKAFEGLDDQIGRETAAWYTGAGAFYAASFSNSLQGFSSNVSSTVASTPSSSGSGFSGGSSGGGGGGGGGGSW